MEAIEASSSVVFQQAPACMAPQSAPAGRGPGNAGDRNRAGGHIAWPEYYRQPRLPTQQGQGFGLDSAQPAPENLPHQPG